MERKNWPALMASIGAVISVLTAVWPGGLLDSNGHQAAPSNLEWWFTAHFIAGSLGIAAILTAHNRFGLARILLGVGALLLFSVMATEPFHFLNVITVIVPGLLMAIGAVAITPPDPSHA